MTDETSSASAGDEDAQQSAGLASSPRQDAPTSKARRPGRGWRWYLIGAAALVLLALIGGAFAAGWAVANQAITADIGHEDTEIVEVPILDPLAGEALMPDVRGLDEQAAMQVIADAGVPVGNVEVTTRPSAGLPGVVVSQTPAFGTSAPETVALVVSAPAAVPDLIGARAEDATAELSIMGAAVAREGRYDPDAPTGTVLAIDPDAGESLPEQVTITVNVAPASVFLTTVEQTQRGCSTAREFLMQGQEYASGMHCQARASESRAAWLLAGAVDRVTGQIGIPDERQVGEGATATVILDGQVVHTFDLAWGTSQPIDIRTTGALKLEFVLGAHDGSSVVGLGDVMLLGDPGSMSRLRAN